jgi:hypothetical protein
LSGLMLNRLEFLRGPPKFDYELPHCSQL